MARRHAGLTQTELGPGTILRVLNKHHVRYIVIGGIAAQRHYLPVRATVDIDITPARDHNNLEGQCVGMSVYERLFAGLVDVGPFDVRTSKCQIAFRRKRGFAYLWLPGPYLKNPQAEVVLSIALGRHDRSERFELTGYPWGDPADLLRLDAGGGGIYSERNPKSGCI